MPKPTIVFVPGGFHTPAIFDPVLPFLHAAGYPTTAVYLPSLGVSPGIPDLSADAKAVRIVASGLAELGREVVIVAHSYGGVPTTEALQGLSKKEREAEGHTGGVIALLFISAHLPAKGQIPVESGKSCSPEEDASPSIIRTVPGGDPTALFCENPIESFYHDVDPAEGKYYASLLRSQSLGPFLTTMTYESYRHIPSSYLLLLNDRAVCLAKQKRMAKNAGIERLLGPMNTGHSPFLSRPEEVSNFIQKVAEGD
ncbi:hypothetical protein AJ78_05368 [Emergomyces pasteurianus Ep9510]|uniref:AB hydrolase-1 domain-containing protein n=1 Tax=Emergomyces pasteurianus Ep9510 TaxID=1447872 RepID=A0A1J9PE31_9EURO|nr:hypothetical protein AJ78_05368 [Emergomyces pasteurianus Ep9510]